MGDSTLDPTMYLTNFVRFLGHERFCIKSVETGKKGAQEAHFDLINANKAVDHIRLRNGKRQLWINVQRLKRNPQKYHKFEDVEAYTNIFLDIDANKPDDRKDYAATEKERGFAIAQLETVKRWLSEKGFKPGLAIKSGNGTGILLPIPPTPPEPEFIAKVAAFLKVVKDETGCDVDPTTYDPPRVCGILQTWNAKLEDEAEGRKNHLRESTGTIPTRDEDLALLRYIEGLEPDRATLATWTKKYNEPTKATPEAKKGPIEHNEDVDVDYVNEKLKALLEGDPKLQGLLDWSEDEQERHNGDRSAAEYGLAGKLVVVGFSDPEIDWIMCHVSKIGKWAEEGDHYRHEMTLRRLRENEATKTEDAAGFSFNELTNPIKFDEDDEPTKWKFSPSKAAKATLSKIPLLTTRGARAKDPLTTWAYDADTGLFREDGEFRIKAALDRAAGDLFTLNAARETIAKIQYESITDRDELDGDPYLLPVSNGVIDLRTGEVLDYSPDLKLTSKCPVKYNPDAKCNRILKYLSESLADPRDVLTVIDMFAVMSIRKAFDAFVALLGQGGNGKLVLENLTETFFGSDQITAVRTENLGRNPFSVGELIGKRALINSEVSGSEKESDWIKRIASGDQCDTDIKHGGHVLFRPHCLQIFDCNNPPQFYDNSYGLQRRFWKLDFPYKFVDNPDQNNPYQKKRDPNLERDISTDEELSGLLNLIIARAPDIIKSGTMYRRVDGSEMFAEYARQARNMETFVDECCIIDRDDYATFITTDELTAAYQAYCEAWNVSAKTSTTFGRYITKVTGKKSVTENGIRYRHFIELRKTDSKNRLEQVRTGLEQDNQQQEQVEQVTSLYLKEIVKRIIGKREDKSSENPIVKENTQNGPQPVLPVLVSDKPVLNLFSTCSNGITCSETEAHSEKSGSIEDVDRPSHLADEPANTSKREMKVSEAKRRPSFESRYLDLSAKYMGRISSEDLKTEFPDEKDRDKAVYHLGILVQSYGWEKRKLKSGLQTWWPPSEVGGVIPRGFGYYSFSGC